jgi:S1-C subfamily serine protease
VGGTIAKHADCRSRRFPYRERACGCRPVPDAARTACGLSPVTKNKLITLISVLTVAASTAPASAQSNAMKAAINFCKELYADERLNPIRGIVVIGEPATLSQQSDSSFIKDAQRPALEALKEVVERCRREIAVANPQAWKIVVQVQPAPQENILLLYNKKITIGQYNKRKQETLEKLQAALAGGSFQPSHVARREDVAALPPSIFRSPTACRAWRKTGRSRRWSDRPNTTFTGSGVVINSRGEILTNSHVVEGCEGIFVQLSSKSLEAGVLVAWDQKNNPCLSG